MAFPDFSEFTFGYAVVRQIEEELGGQFVAPSFPTSVEEASRGYDVEVLTHGVPLFIQFKRSEVMRRRPRREYEDMGAAFKPPIFRMHLHPRLQFRQHHLMQKIESDGNVAVYCTSAVEDKDALDALYADRKVFDAATFFSPHEIILPSRDSPHHVSFCRGSRKAWVYSGKGAPFDRHTITLEDLKARLRAHRDHLDVTTQIEHLRELANDFDRVGPEWMARGQWPKHFHAHDSDPKPHSEEELISASARVARRQRTRDIESVVKRVAIEAFFEVDAMLVSVSKKAFA